jgi:hypothetical protein
MVYQIDLVAAAASWAVMTLGFIMAWAIYNHPPTPRQLRRPSLHALLAWPAAASRPAVGVAPVGDLAAIREIVPLDDLRECRVCAHLHCAGCANPAAITATDTGAHARHDFSEVPPSLQWLASVVHVSFRARLVANAVNPRWNPVPHHTRVAFEVWAGQKLGRPFRTTPRLGWVLP